MDFSSFMTVMLGLAAFVAVYYAVNTQQRYSALAEERNQLRGQAEGEKKRAEEKDEQLRRTRQATDEAKQEMAQQLRQLQEDQLRLKQQAVVETVYTLVVDGPPAAGKSSLIYKLMNPGGDISALEATPDGWESPLWPVIFVEGQNGPRNLYCIKANDNAGETPNTVNDLAGRIDAKQGVIIIVVDILDLDGALSRFTPAFIKAQYFTKLMLEKADGAIIYVNKIDRSEDVFTDVSREQVERQVTEKLKPVLETLSQRYPPPKVVFGSAKTEENLFRLLSEIHRSMKIADKFPRHPSAPPDHGNGQVRSGRA